MRANAHVSPSTADLIARAAICAGAAAAVVTLSALAVAVSGLADDARRVLRFGFGGVERTPAEAARIALHNARFAGGTLLCAAARPRIPVPLRRVIDTLLAALLVFNAGAVGLALGAYGMRVANAIALHTPLEFAALSLAGGAYIQASKQPLGLSALARIAGLCAVLLATAAALETYASLGGVR